jgi:enoyl-CoA hydratase
MVADVGTLQRLPHLIGQGMTRELAYTGRQVDASEAEKIGLINRVFASPEALTAAVHELAQTIAAKSPLAIARPQGSHELQPRPFRSRWPQPRCHLERRDAAFGDLKECMTAQHEKRPPQFAD